MKELRIQTTEATLSALAWGDDSMHPVIAVPGLLDNAASFIPLAEQLSNINLVALDLPGHGKSEHRTGASAYYVIDYATDVLLAANALGFQKFSILGHSIGGIVGAVLAAGVPKRIRRLAMLDGMAPPTEHPVEFPARVKKLFSFIDRTSKGPRIYSSKAEACKSRYDATENGYISKSAAALLAERNLIETDGGYKWRTDRKLRIPTPMYWTEDHVLYLLPLVKCESLFVLPESGILQDYGRQPARSNCISNLKVIEVEGDHHVHMDDPKIVAPHVQSFLDR